MITRTLDASIKSFQRDKGLRVDGRIRPDGETETAIKKEQAKQQKEEREKQEEKRKKCARFRNDLRIARIRLEGIDKELTEAIEQVNMTLKLWQKAHEEYIRRNAEAAMKTASSVDKGVLGAVGFASTLVNEIPEVEAAKKKAEEAEERHQAAQNHEAYLQREKKERYRDVERIQKEIEKTGCR